MRTPSNNSTKCALLYSVQVQQCFDYMLEFVMSVTVLTNKIIPQVKFIQIYSIKVL